MVLWLAAVCRHSTPQLTVSHTAAHCSSATSMLLSRPHPSLFISFLYLFSANLSVSRCKARQFLGLSTTFTCQYTLSTETLYCFRYIVPTPVLISIMRYVIDLLSSRSCKNYGSRWRGFTMDNIRFTMEGVQETLSEAIKSNEALHQSVA